MARLVEEGADIILTDIAEKAGRAAVKRLGAEFIAHDVTSTESWNKVIGDVAASRVAVAQLTRSVATHCAQAGFNIHCNSVHPQTD